ncbi:hypothetical protein [Nocardioides sp.]|uniref:hypothetical protein n=1 Tax=Nocardioides sp. TaxID=35761 RepID=UPI002BB0A7B1|nr:hypothetical protein [Nocardioides sp.]HSX68141.1 hypothetical protein [Nocardioides sp.]
MSGLAQRNQASRVWVCSECSAVGHSDPDHRGCGLPRNWGHYNPMACFECVSYAGPRPPREDARPICGRCVLRTIDAAIEALRRSSW